MPTYFTTEHTADLSDYDATTGQVTWMPCGGHEGSGSLFAVADSGAAYATADLGDEKAALFARCRISPQLGYTGNALRGRNAAGQTAWQLATTWLTPKTMALTLRVYLNDGSYKDFDLTPDLDNNGMIWAEVKILAGSEWGNAAAWLGGDSVLADTRVPPNDARPTRYLDVGASAATAEPRVNIDCVTAGDEYVGPKAWTPVKERTWTQHACTYEIWSVFGEPSGGWQGFCDPDSGFTIESYELIRGRIGRVQLGDASGRSVLEIPSGWDGCRRDEPLQACRVRFQAIGAKCRFSACVLRRS